jgi:hypothetical protein
MKKVKLDFSLSDTGIVKALKRVKKVLSSKKELWQWISWTFFRKESLDNTRELVTENIDFGKLLHKKETLRALNLLKENYKDVVQGHVALSVINEIIDFIEKDFDGRKK